jgi:hypothetical protein
MSGTTEFNVAVPNSETERGSVLQFPVLKQNSVLQFPQLKENKFSAVYMLNSRPAVAQNQQMKTAFLLVWLTYP